MLTSPDGALAQLAAADLAAAASVPMMALDRRHAGLDRGWTAARDRAPPAWPTRPTMSSCRRANAARTAKRRCANTSTWEINLVNDMANDDDHRFQVVAS